MDNVFNVILVSDGMYAEKRLTRNDLLWCIEGGVTGWVRVVATNKRGKTRDGVSPIEAGKMARKYSPQNFMFVLYAID